MGLGTYGVLDLMTGYQPAATLTAAARLGVFDALETSSLSDADVAALCRTEPLATRALLDSLVGLGLLARDGELYAGTEDSARLCVAGDLRLVAEKEAFLARVWLELEESVRTGEPRLDPWTSRLASNPAQARSFLEALVVLADTTGPDLTSVIPEGASVVDLGGGLGAYAAPLSTAGRSVTLVDLPPVAEWAREVLPSSVSVLPVDLLAPSAPSSIGDGYDVALLSHLLHDLTDEDCLTVLSLARSVLRPGGRVVVFELPGDPPGSFGPLFDLMMRVETAGRARRTDELVDLMRLAGLSGVEVSPSHPRPHGVLTGKA
ncbi:methyltransferase [Nocardioides sp. W7]|uniref:methyltransferase n=1 Tax=Nocardioides sp. W7 TaxID=2931390 RepID=UPI001FD29AB8|nr:methyltransferase [Nocardioides sp. W7]